jgi:hypothetical protein
MRASRCLMFLLAGLLAFSMLFGAEFPDVPHVGNLVDPWVLYNSPTVALTWNPYVGIELVKAECQVAFRIGDATTPGDFTTTYTITDTALLNDPVTPKLPLRQYVENLANGTYWCRVRVTDSNGNESDWSELLVFVKDWKAIEPPGGCALLR